MNTEKLACPTCHQTVTSAYRFCTNCGANLAVAAVRAEMMLTSSPKSAPAVTSPEDLIPRLGDRLVDRGVITRDQLRQALERQKWLVRQGRSIRLGQILVQMGLVDAATLDECVTQQLLQLKEALEKNNEELEQRVQARTSELQQMLARLSQLNQLKANFVASLSHELRTPLFQAMGNLELLANGDYGSLSTEQALAINSVQDATSQLRELIEELLQFSQAATGKLPLQLAPIPLGKPIETAVAWSLPKAQARDIHLGARLVTADSIVRADGEKITWVLGELLNNAIKFTPAGGRVEVAAMARQHRAVVAVRDTGVGIPRERMGEIFEPFHQLDGSITRQHGGIGLGLALARRIVEAHGSDIHVRSGETGSQFVFSLPLATA